MTTYTNYANSANIDNCSLTVCEERESLNGGGDYFIQKKRRQKHVKRIQCDRQMAVLPTSVNELVVRFAKLRYRWNIHTN